MADPQDEEPRAGSRVLSLFENPLNVRVLRALVAGPTRLADLRKAIGWSAESTIRASISALCEEGALAKERRGESQAVVTCWTDIQTGPPTWGVGTADAWLDAVIDGSIERLRIGGNDPQFALDLVAGLHTALFPADGNSGAAD